MMIEKISQHDAMEIANNWKYPEPYNFYDMTEDIEDYEELISPEKRANHYFSLKEQDDLLGFFCVFPFEDKADEIDFGVGIRPDLTGKGLGEEYILVILQYLYQSFAPKKIWLSVASFNQRAMKVYSRLGFHSEYEKMQATNGSEYQFIVMSKAMNTLA